MALCTKSNVAEVATGVYRAPLTGAWDIPHAGDTKTHFQYEGRWGGFAITDVAWCPDNSTVFAAVAQSGKLQIWDLSVSCLDPVVSVDTTGDEKVKSSKKKKKKDKNEEEIDSETAQGPKGAPMLPLSL